MQSMHIVSCKVLDFDQFPFRTGKGATTPVEGRRVDIRYQINSGNKAPSPLAPVATNDSEEGRAKNRRVELVKQ